MTAPRLAPAVRHLRCLLARHDAGGGSDAQLLQRFVSHRDEGAFELLVWRHGPMAYGVCRRVLRDGPDAEDAFQAALLALARKAASIGKRQSVGAWLYKVAYRVALRARAGALRRARRERQVAQLPAVADPRVAADPAWAELRPVLDEELSRLAERHRAPVVLCYLEGLTNAEAAGRLRCPVGTVKTRLAHARRVLGRRLARRGLALAAGLLAAGAVPPAAPALPAALVGATTRAAALAAAGEVGAAGAASAQVAGLTEGVLRAMSVAKLKVAALALAAGLAAAGAGVTSYRASARGAPPPGPGEPVTAPPKVTSADARVRRLRERIAEMQGELRRAEEAAERERAAPPPRGPVAVIFGGVPITRDELADHLLARLRPGQLEGYVNRRILEHACRREGVTVTEAEVEGALKAELKEGKLTEGAFRDLLRGRQQTLREWKEDVLRPRLLLAKLARRRARVGEADLRRTYEARYGERVECQFIPWPAGQGEAAESAARRLRAGEVTFEELARRQPAGERAVEIGRGSTGEEGLEEAALALRPGEVSGAIHLRTGSVILRCRRRTPADTSTRFEDVREALEREVREKVSQKDAEKLLKELKAEARARWLWRPAGDNAGP